MAANPVILAFDLGTTSIKSCLYELAEPMRLLGSSVAEYPIRIMDGGKAEQDPEDWINAMTETSRKVMHSSGVLPDKLGGIAFSSQMQGLVLTGEEGRHLRPAMSYMDQRAVDVKRRFGKGFCIDDIPLLQLLSSIRITGIAPTSVKDPVWKYLWVKEHESELFGKVRYWFDVKDYVIYRLTGKAVCTRDSACAAALFDNRPGQNCWSSMLCRIYGVNQDHLPKIIQAHETAGKLAAQMAEQMGLRAGIPVFGGGGDASTTGLGSGAVNEKQAHLYMGTSGWISVVTKKRITDITRKIASITCAIPEHFHYFCEQETSGKCLEWVKDHLALDEIGIYLKKTPVTDNPETIYKNLFEYMNEIVNQSPPGCRGLLFAPWLHGSRSPFEDPNARGMFFNIGLNMGKRDMIRSVIEGLAFNSRWMIESIEKKVRCEGPVRFVGGGALSEATARIFADISGRVLEVPEHPQNAGALGAALIAALGYGWLSSHAKIPGLVKIAGIYKPDSRHRAAYERQYRVFRELYPRNRKLFSLLNGNS